MTKNERAITLVALIITIIVLLILAVVSIMAVTGTGLFSKTNDAVDKYENSRAKENFLMDNHVSTINSYLGGISNKSSNTSSTSNTSSNSIEESTPPVIDPIVGTYGYNGKDTVIFNQDGTFTYSNGTSSGTWSKNGDEYTLSSHNFDGTYTLSQEGNLSGTGLGPLIRQ